MAEEIIIPEEWSNAADTIAYGSTTMVALVCGPKNSGKTTFSRHLLNVLLQRYKKVAYLDTDVGQPEFTTPGLLSLTVIDQSYSQCFFFGDTSSKRDPTTYMTYIFALYDYYRKLYCQFSKSESSDVARVPLVINTPGWVKGVGYDILVDMLKYISPTHVIKICISAERKNLPAGTFWLNDGEDTPPVSVLELNSARRDSYNRSLLVQKDARLFRDLRMIAYFRQCFPSNKNITTIKELAHALAAHPPYEISISDIKIKHLHCQVPKSETFYSLNATIVGLAVSTEDCKDMPHCLGLGIVRGIDTFSHVLYVITPVPLHNLEKVDLLLQGFLEIPSSLLQVQGCKSPYMSGDVLPVN
ncbi:hypothetical protein Leryth_023029 [Lithospermum erythrorhizon]|nr:hypothetical protein Leryth_023029 [Lithospermum erythrorhizon]